MARALSAYSRYSVSFSFPTALALKQQVKIVLDDRSLVINELTKYPALLPSAALGARQVFLRRIDNDVSKQPHSGRSV